MKAQWEELTARIDALALRERVMIFAALACLLVYTSYSMLAVPMLAKQEQARAQIAAQQEKMAALNAQIAERIASTAQDPDAAGRMRLARLLSEQTALGSNLRTVQRGLVAPEKMAPLLEQILHSHGKLKLMSLHSLPVTTVDEAAPLTAMPAAPEEAAAKGGQAISPAEAARAVVADAAKQAAANAAKTAPPAPAAPAAPPPRARSLLYRHGVEMVLQGSYLDMVSYMDALERLPVQLFWGRAALDAAAYPEVKLSLTLYTLSLDDKWMKL